MAKLKPAIATHPGETLADELWARQMSQTELSLRSGLAKTAINEIIKGKRPINANYAIKLEYALGIDAEYWMTSQINYELDKIRLRNKRRMSNKQKTAVDEMFTIIDGLIEYSPGNPLLAQLKSAQPRLKQIEREQIEKAVDHTEQKNAKQANRILSAKFGLGNYVEPEENKGECYYNQTYWNE